MNGGLLTDAVKETIQASYRAWLRARGFRARRGQREMIAQVANTFALDVPPRIAAIEAGTGTGKTAAYCLAAIPLAKALNKTVVISTATVALQEQVVLRDLPDLEAHAALDFTHTLAKGRGRYVCLKRLDGRLRHQDQTEIPMFEMADSAAAELYQAMLQAFTAMAWDGDRDSWPRAVDDAPWQAVTTDHRGCSNNRCSFFRECPFFRARRELESAQVIVTNHDLLLSDLGLGGGAVLPDPEECVYIVDEAHHLPEKTQQHFAVSARIGATAQWADSVAGVLGSLAQRFARPRELVRLAAATGEHAAKLIPAMERLKQGLSELDFRVRDENLAICRFSMGTVPEPIREMAEVALQPASELADDIGRAHQLLQKTVAGETGWANAYEAEDWLSPVGQLHTRALATVALFEDYAARVGEAAMAEETDDSAGTSHARWVNDSGGDLELVSAPVLPGQLLHAAFWSRCYAAICTSATLTALGGFDRFFQRAGLRGVPGLRIPSPFDFPAIATLTVPAMRSDPRDFDEHTREVAELLPELLDGDPGGLILFTSKRQLREVVRRLPESFVRKLRIQGDGSKQALLDAHRHAVQAGEQSYLAGLASFAEGVDLPDDLCRHVVIVKLPFAVPDDPLDEAMAEWCEARGGNPFYDIAVPDAALRLEQACGRLIRHEGDHGRITLLDRRVVTQRYGRRLLDSLPPYRLLVSRT